MSGFKKKNKTEKEKEGKKGERRRERKGRKVWKIFNYVKILQLAFVITGSVLRIFTCII